MICNLVGYLEDGTIVLRAKVRPGQEGKVGYKRPGVTLLMLKKPTYVSAHTHIVVDGAIEQLIE